jgi:hypothetical protein
MKHSALFAALMLSLASGTATAEKDHPTPARQETKIVAAKPKGCPKGFVSMGDIVKIETGKDGSVTESIKLKNGTIQKMPKFKPTKNYDSKVGDAYCMDMTADND